jgi:hypothetical protein
MRAPSVKPQYGPTLPELLIPRWRLASVATRRLTGAAVLLVVVAGVGVAVLHPRKTSYVHRGPPVAFNLSYPRPLVAVKPPAGAYMRIEARSSSGRLLQWYEVDPLTLGAYSGEISGQLPVFASNYIVELARRVPDFLLQTETKTRINQVAGYSVTYSGEIDGQLMYGRIVLIVPRLTGDRIGVILNMGTVPSVAVDYSPDQVGSADLLEIPLRSFRFGA